MAVRPFQTNVVQKIKTHILCSVTFLWNRAVYDIMWNNFVKPLGHRWQYGVCSLHAGYLRLQTHTQYVIFITFSRQQWLQERASLLRSTYIAHHQAHSVLQVCASCRLLFLSKQTTCSPQMSPHVMLYQSFLHSVSADTNHAIRYFASCFCKFTSSCAAPL